MARIHGKNALVTVEGTGTMHATEYTWESVGEKLPCATFDTNGKHQYLIGLTGSNWSINGYWDSSFSEHPPGLYVRDDGGTIFFNPPGSLIPAFVCERSQIRVTVSGLAEYSASGSETIPNI